MNKPTQYTGITLKTTYNDDGKVLIWKNVLIDTDASFMALRDRHYKEHGINYESYYILDANGEQVYAHAGIQDKNTKGG